MLTKLGFDKDFAKVPLYCKNTAMLHALGNPSFSFKAKHIALRLFSIRELVSGERTSIHYISTDINPADIGIMLEMWWCLTVDGPQRLTQSRGETSSSLTDDGLDDGGSL